MHILGRLNKSIYNCISEDIIDDEVIITENQLEHIRARHPEVIPFIIDNIKQALEEPDYIIEDKHRDTGLVIKKLKMQDEYIQIVLKISTSKDKKGYKNSIISTWEISEKRLNNYLRNKRILYSRV